MAARMLWSSIRLSKHIIDPVKFAGEIRRVLWPGGCCVVTMPNFRYIKNGIVKRSELLSPKFSIGGLLCIKQKIQY